MHMADALLSPGVGAGLWVAAAGLVSVCSRRLQRIGDDRRVPLMGVLGAFVFAAQMINFGIPGTGASGHLGGGLLLAVLLGPYAAILVLASVLAVQALFFADGGLLALGCNLVNLGFFPAFVGYPLFRRIAGGAPGRTRLAVAAVVAAVVSLQLGALAAVLETTASGVSSLPFGTFLLFMQPIHLAIGVVEGLVTASLLAVVLAARPGLLEPVPAAVQRPGRHVVASFLAAAAITGGLLSWVASARPDGLEWSVARVSGSADLVAAPGTHGWLARLQSRLALLPGHGFVSARDAVPVEAGPVAATRAGASVAGLLGGSITLLVALAIGRVLRRHTRGP